MIRVLNLGAGVQSSTLLLMACEGEIQVDRAVFADTQFEPKRVYTWLNWLMPVASKAGIPVSVVTAGDIVEPYRTHSTSCFMPFFIQNPDGSVGRARRACTVHFKIDAIERWIRRDVLGLRPRQRAPRTPVVTKIFGISYDELQRMRTPKEPWQLFEYPLVDRRMTRLDCMVWLEGHGYPIPGRSSCIGCPNHDDAFWRSLSPEEFERACEFDELIRVGRSKKYGKKYLHRSCVPLREVDLSTGPTTQDDMFADECMGLCGT
jgi:hypothetical protein